MQFLYRRLDGTIQPREGGLKYRYCGHTGIHPCDATDLWWIKSWQFLTPAQIFCQKYVGVMLGHKKYFCERLFVHSAWRCARKKLTGPTTATSNTQRISVIIIHIPNCTTSLLSLSRPFRTRPPPFWLVPPKLGWRSSL